MNPDLVSLLGAYEDVSIAASAANRPKPKVWQAGRSEWNLRQKDLRRAEQRCSELGAEVGSDEWDQIASRHVIDVYLTTGVDGRQKRDYRILDNPVEYARRVAETETRCAVEEICAERPPQVTPSGLHMMGSGYTVKFAVEQVPELHHRVSDPGFVEGAIRAYLSGIRDVALDRTMLVARGETHDGGDLMLVQHKASGLRATFNESTPRPFYGAYSKPYKIENIDPDRTETPGARCPGWRDWAGMGIGATIYRHAATVLPDARFLRGMTSDYSRPLRSRLHQEDPFRWENGGECDWCREHVIEWRDPALTRDDFADHP